MQGTPRKSEQADPGAFRTVGRIWDDAGVLCIQ